MKTESEEVPENIKIICIGMLIGLIEHGRLLRALETLSHEIDIIAMPMGIIDQLSADSMIKHVENEKYNLPAKHVIIEHIPGSSIDQLEMLMQKSGVEIPHALTIERVDRDDADLIKVMQEEMDTKSYQKKHYKKQARFDQRFTGKPKTKPFRNRR